MNSYHVRRKWRPSLGMIVFAVFLTVLALPLAVTAIFRLFDNELVRQTERELLAQSAVIASVCAVEIEAWLASGYPLGKAQPKKSDARYNPTLAKLDLTKDLTLPPRPDAETSSQNMHPAVAEMGARISRIANLTREKTLAGFRIVDTTGQVFAGSGEIGLSLAHVREVAEALEGEQRSVVRARTKDRPDPPLSSISRSSNIRVFTAMPVIVEGRVAAVVYASRTPQSLTKYIYNERWGILLAALSALLAAGVIGFVFLRTVNGPLHALLKRTRSLGEGDRSALAPLDRYGTRELAQLSEGIFTTAKRLFDRTDFISTFAAHVSHELKSPLTSIQGAAELMRDSEDTMSAQERRKFLDNIVSDTDRLTTTVAQLRDLARADNPQLGSTTTFDAVAAKLLADGRPLPIEIAGDVDVPIAISTDNAAIVVSHLIDNAARHRAQTVKITVQKEGTVLKATVTDDGSGIAEGIREKIFEPFYSTEREAGGTGMGLAIVRTMLEAHGGSIRLGRYETGTAFVIELPCSRSGTSR
ncbi:MAG: HAMP domain-containing histidine kinase [Hyphomicrobiales bacterium]|nr:HAMP domain-containing histidine kinase [Hyphomicrobiales bacterium]MCP5000662.1 HAMP domain-containing histidine kinase [Hyphomicrobiales bacterium]